MNIVVNLVIALLRFYACWKAMMLKKLGIVVICDRWVNTVPKGIDGPRSYDESDKKLNFVQKLERFMYHNVPVPDLNITLDVAEQTVIERNFKRTKSGKETKEEIKKRYIKFKKMNIKAVKNISVNNNVDFDSSYEKLMSLIRAEFY